MRRYVEKLSPREQQCLLLAAEDYRTRETAEQLQISEGTVKSYRKLILQKLQCRTIAGALKVALEHRLIEIRDN